MANITSIEWADLTINPVVGCSKCSPGCDNCYAERMANRLKAMAEKEMRQSLESQGKLSGKSKYLNLTENGKWTGNTFFDEPVLESLTRLKKPRRIFVSSMGDLFHESVPFNWIHHVWDAMKACPQHTFLVLTKRAKRMSEVLDRIYRLERFGWAKGFWDHVHLGVTVCNQDEADRKIPYLLDTWASVRFLSIEPILGPVIIPQSYPHRPHMSISSIHHIICGGESGPRARLLHPDWVRSLRDQCVAADIPFLFKQWGEWWPAGKKIVENKRMVLFGKEPMYRIGKKCSGRTLDGQIWDQYPSNTEETDK